RRAPDAVTRRGPLLVGDLEEIKRRADDGFEWRHVESLPAHQVWSTSQRKSRWNLSSGSVSLSMERTMWSKDSVWIWFSCAVPLLAVGLALNGGHRGTHRPRRSSPCESRPVMTTCAATGWSRPRSTKCAIATYRQVERKWLMEIRWATQVG